MKTKPKANPDIVRRLLPAVLWALIIFYFSSLEQIPASRVFVFDFALKKAAHVIEYAILFILIFRATNKKFALSFVLTMLYAVSDEYHQSFVPGRRANIIDLGIDFSGANIAAYSLWKLEQIRHRKPAK